MKTITESLRKSAPARLPQSIAWDGSSIWIGSIANNCIYQIDTKTWKTTWKAEAPGKPWGMTCVGEDLRVICGETEEDNRFIRRLIPGEGFDPGYKLPCPDDTGSQLGFDGETLHLSQWYNRKVLALNADGIPQKEYTSPRGICGQAIVDDKIYILNTDDEETDEYFIGRFDSNTGVYEDLAGVPFKARALAFDGSRFWTNHREAHETVSFTL